jgi:8-oxo-dGTP pyrophosphatase MutT (NUDIX family)
MIEEISCGIVPVRKTQQGFQMLLIYHQKGRHWSFPKGHQDPGETDLETAKRELKEETGLEIEALISEDVYKEQYTFYKLHQKVHKTVTYFPAFVKGTLELQAEEILEARWLFIPDAIAYLTFKEAKEICHKVFCLLENRQ